MLSGTAFLINTLQSSEISYQEANKPVEWRNAIQSELNAMQTNGVFVKINKKPNENTPVVDNKRTFKLKKNSDGNLLHQARLCVRGFKDRTKYDISKTYAPVIKIDI